MFKKFEEKDIVFLQGNVKEYASIGPYAVSVKNVRTFNHWTSGTVSGSYYHACLNDTTNSVDAIEIYDISYGFSKKSSYYASSSASVFNLNEKLKMYRLFAKNLLGNENFTFKINGQEKNELVFLALKRNQFKDAILEKTVNVSGWSSASAFLFTNFNDVFSGESKKSFAGQYNELFSSSNFINYGGFISASSNFGQTIINGSSIAGGLVFYDAGMFVLDPGVCFNTSSTTIWSGTMTYPQLVSGGISGSTYENLLYAVRQQISIIYYDNIIKMKNTIYNCYANKEEYNYSTNPSFLKPDGQIIATSGSITNTNFTSQTYITKIGFFDKNGACLAIASLPKPVRKNKNIDILAKVRITY